MKKSFFTGIVQGLILGFFATALEDEGLRLWFVIAGALAYSLLRPWTNKEG